MALAIACGKARDADRAEGEPSRADGEEAPCSDGSCGSGSGMQGTFDVAGGANPSGAPAERGSAAPLRCGEDVTLFYRPDVEAIAGCEEVASIQVRSARLSLRPLGKLRRVSGPSGFDTDQLRNLDGLQGLEEVAFDFHMPAVDEVRALQSLRKVGRLLIYSDTLVDLTGLENLTSYTELSLGGSQLADTSALPLSPELRSLGLSGEGLSDDVDRFAALALESLSLKSLSLSDLSVFQALPREMLTVSLGYNTLLRDIGALARLESLERLELNDNPALVDLPDFSSVRRLDHLRLENNASMRAIPRFPALDALGADGTGTLTISRNAALETIEGLATLAFAGDILIEDNPNLTRIDLGSLRSANSIVIRNNPRLMSLQLGSIESVAQRVIIVQNASLDSATLATVLLDVSAPFRKIVTSAEAGQRLDPCPWFDDEACDEVDGLCAPNTDWLDCP